MTTKYCQWMDQLITYLKFSSKVWAISQTQSLLNRKFFLNSPSSSWLEVHWFFCLWTDMGPSGVWLCLKIDFLKYPFERLFYGLLSQWLTILVYTVYWDLHPNVCKAGCYWLHKFLHNTLLLLIWVFATDISTYIITDILSDIANYISI